MILFAGDKGGNTMKFHVEIINSINSSSVDNVEKPPKIPEWNKLCFDHPRQHNGDLSLAMCTIPLSQIPKGTHLPPSFYLPCLPSTY